MAAFAIRTHLSISCRGSGPIRQGCPERNEWSPLASTDTLAFPHFLGPVMLLVRRLGRSSGCRHLPLASVSMPGAWDPKLVGSGPPSDSEPLSAYMRMELALFSTPEVDSYGSMFSMTV